LKLNIPERVAGPDLAEALCQRAEKRGYRLFFMGSSQENLDMLKKALLGRYPALNIVGMLSPSMCDRFSDEENQKIIAEVRHAAPDILFVGISTQKQEIWMSENLQKLNVPASLGVGAAFDFLSGRVPRAPEWLQKNGLEWMYRLFCEPKRLWKRYLLGNALFLYLLIKESLRRRLA
jgi:N-acetylglucosaminyldiphosphoundecaprenol N-acetyl-beta-D-mannosaminyltransferase